MQQTFYLAISWLTFLPDKYRICQSLNIGCCSTIILPVNQVAQTAVPNIFPSVAYLRLLCCATNIPSVNMLPLPAV